jgi:hypothetical protein
VEVFERLDRLLDDDQLDCIFSEPFRDYWQATYTPTDERRQQVALLVIVIGALASTGQPVTKADLLAAYAKLAALDPTRANALKLKPFVSLLRNDPDFFTRMIRTGGYALGPDEPDLTAVRARDTRARASTVVPSCHVAARALRRERARRASRTRFAVPSASRRLLVRSLSLVRVCAPRADSTPSATAPRVCAARRARPRRRCGQLAGHAAAASGRAAADCFGALQAQGDRRGRGRTEQGRRYRGG